MPGKCQKYKMLIGKNNLRLWHLDADHLHLSTCKASVMSCFVLCYWHSQSISLPPYALNLLAQYVFNWAVNLAMHKKARTTNHLKCHMEDKGINPA